MGEVCEEKAEKDTYIKKIHTHKLEMIHDYRSLVIMRETLKKKKRKILTMSLTI